MQRKSVTEYLENTARYYPDKPAIVDAQGEMTFTELQLAAKKVASMLISRGIYQKPVVVFMEKSAACIASFMGAAYSGNFYTPVDDSMPEARIEKILDVLHPACIIVSEKQAEKAASFSRIYPVLLYQKIQAECTVTEKEIEDVETRSIDTDLLYVLFTSGSTGMPKGVAICHRSVIDYTEWVADTFKIDNNHRFGNQAPFYFDNSILDIYQMLKTGATLYLIPRQLFSFPVRLLEYIKENQLNIIFWVPSALCLVANSGALNERDISCLKKILFAGEVMPVKQLCQWKKALPEALFANLYGPTEITDVCTYYVIDNGLSEIDTLPIGKPCRNTDVIVLNENNKLVQQDEIGELCIRGSSLALGYYNAPEKTAEAFVQNPLNPFLPETIYRTGDLVRYNESGDLLYCGRKDFQIKHMGYRIELGEIEAAVSSLDGIERCCCIYEEEKKQIILFYCGSATSETISQRLAGMLPRYMLPHVNVRLEKMPFNINGKIDRLTLKDMLKQLQL